ncbi:MAG: hypothetical protein ACKORI_06625, partial [Verrucomicrobiota bacterium]
MRVPRQVRKASQSPAREGFTTAGPAHAGYASLGCEKVALDESFTTPDGPAWAGPAVVKPSLAGDWDAFLTWRG